MGKVTIECTVDFEDYFNWLGFGDGDDGIQVAVAADLEDQMVDFLDERLRRLDPPWGAELGNPLTIHNEHRIEISRLGFEATVDTDDLRVLTPGDEFGPGALVPRAELDAVDAILRAARDEFDALCAGWRYE